MPPLVLLGPLRAISKIFPPGAGTSPGSLGERRVPVRRAPEPGAHGASRSRGHSRPFSPALPRGLTRHRTELPPPASLPSASAAVRRGGGLPVSCQPAGAARVARRRKRGSTPGACGLRLREAPGEPAGSGRSSCLWCCLRCPRPAGWEPLGGQRLCAPGVPVTELMR